jgi:hypothetical protein
MWIYVLVTDSRVLSPPGNWIVQNTFPILLDSLHSKKLGLLLVPIFLTIPYKCGIYTTFLYHIELLFRTPLSAIKVEMIIYCFPLF